MVAVQTITISCPHCGEKTKGTLEAWTKGFPCPSCNGDICRPGSATPINTAVSESQHSVSNSPMGDDGLSMSSGLDAPVQPVMLKKKGKTDTGPVKLQKKNPSSSIKIHATAEDMEKSDVLSASNISIMTGGASISGDNLEELKADVLRYKNKAKENATIAKKLKDQNQTMKLQVEQFKIKAIGQRDSIKAKAELEVKKAEVELRVLKEQLETTAKDRNKIELEKSQLSIKIKEKAQEQVKAKIESVSSQYKEKISALESKHDELQKEYDKLQAGSSTEDEGHERSKKEVEILKGKYIEAEKAKQEAHQKITGLEDKITSNDGEQSKKISAENTVLKEEVIKAKTEMEKIKQETTAIHSGEMATLQNENEELKAQVDGIQGGNVDAGELEKLKTENRQLSEKTTQLHVVITDLEAKNEELGANPSSEDFSRKEMENDVLHKKVMDLATQLKEAKTSENPETESKLNELAIQNKKLKQMVIKLKEREGSSPKTPAAEVKKAPAEAPVAEEPKAPVAETSAPVEEVKAPVAETPAAPANANSSGVPEAIMTLAQASAEGEEIKAIIATKEKISKSKSTAWCVVTSNRLLIIAVGKKDSLESIPLVKLDDSFWNRISKKLFLSPSTPSVKTTTLAMDPDKGKELIELIKG